MGEVATELTREALRADSGGAYRGDFPVFTVREGAPPLTSEMVADALDES
jgi:hypothetical protein